MSENETEGTARVDQLPLFDQLLHGIGQVAQQQASLESDLNHLRLSLSWHRRRDEPFEQGIKNHVKACRKLLAESGAEQSS